MLTVRLHKTQSTLAMLQRKYGDEGHEADTGTSLRSELTRLRDEIKNEQAAHGFRNRASQKARINFQKCLCSNTTHTILALPPRSSVLAVPG